MPGYKHIYSTGYTGTEQMIYSLGRDVGAGHRIAVFLHGRGGDCHFASPGAGPLTGAAQGLAATPSASPVDSYMAQHVRALCDLGFGVAQIDAAGPAAWGNAAQAAAITAAIAAARATYGASATAKILLYGFSMGDIAAMNWAKTNLAAVAGLYMTFPACDLDYHQANNFPDEINAAFTATTTTIAAPLVALNQVGSVQTVVSTAGFAAAGTFVLRTGWATYTRVTYTGTTATTFTGCTIAAGTVNAAVGNTVSHVGDYAANAAGRNPILFCATVAAQGIPWRGWYSTGDAVVPPATTTAFAAAYGPRASALVIPGAPPHGSGLVGTVPAADLVAFAQGLTF